MIIALWTIFFVCLFSTMVSTSKRFDGFQNFCCYKTTEPTICKPLITQFKTFTIWNRLDVTRYHKNKDFKVLCCAKQYTVLHNNAGSCQPQSTFKRYYIDYDFYNGP